MRNNVIMCIMAMVLLVSFINVNAMESFPDDHSATDENVKPLRVAFFIDDHSERFGRGKAITSEFARQFSEKAPHLIIVSNYILKNLILRKYTTNPERYFAETNIEFNDWDIYLLNNTQFFILVRRNYDNPLFNKIFWTKIDLSSGNAYTGDGNENFPTISWAANAPSEVKRLLDHKNMKYITYAKDAKTPIGDLKAPETTIHKKFNPIQLSWIFKPPKDYNELSMAPPCNICMLGHGSYFQKINNWKYPADISRYFTAAGMSLEDMRKTLIFFNDKLNTKSVRISTCYAGGKNLDTMRVKNEIHLRMKYLFIVDSITDAPAMGLNIKKHKGTNLKEYFEALDKFLYGDQLPAAPLKALRDRKNGNEEHDAVITAEIKKLISEHIKPNIGFQEVLKSLSLIDVWYFLPIGLNNFPQIWIPEIGWFQTFTIDPDIQKITARDMVKSLVKPTVKIIKIQTTEGIKDLRVLDFKQQSTIEIKKKLALLIHPEIVVVNLSFTPNLQIAFHKDKNQPDVDDLSKDNARMWLLNLYKYFPSIPCFDSVYISKSLEKNFYIYPQIMSMQRGDSLNLFAKISISSAGQPSTETGILNFLRDGFLVLRERKTVKTFFIKELEGFNDFSQILDKNDDFKKFLDNKDKAKKQVILQNVFIQTSMDNSKITHISISFDCEGKAWKLVYEAKNLNLGGADLPSNISTSLWQFKEAGDAHKKNLRTSNLTYLAELSSAEYYAQLPIIRDIIYHKKTHTKKKDPTTIVSFQSFLKNLDRDEIKRRMQATPRGTDLEWKNFEQKVQLRLKLKTLKTSLAKLKQNLLMLQSKLKQLKNRITRTV